ncbi:Uncharacterized protein YbcI [Mesobacillus persicus]|uniref:Uncharacterized protein YbcI n=1 Tax=Mesobacillus persicus TaxID=930146 RepID=A0A1H7WMN8_9BACI|nr:Na-translocating system protein MpsC family protein [Mesobacillus persicus]SEM22177.1 Uncharacterized protein YbcI [Mesobacillus persicus]
MSSPTHEKLKDISSLTSKLLRKNFGRGPESCYAFASNHFLVFYIRGFLSPMESILIKSGSADKVDISRSIVMKSILAQLKGILELEFKQDIECFYHDWNYPQNTGMITAMFESELKTDTNHAGESSADVNRLIDEVDRISILVQKKPEKTKVFQISPKLYIVKRDGILVQIEKALIQKGYDQELIVTKDELEKSYFHRDGRFDEIFQQEVADILIDWNVDKDNSVMCFVLK